MALFAWVSWYTILVVCREERKKYIPCNITLPRSNKSKYRNISRKENCGNLYLYYQLIFSTKRMKVKPDCIWREKIIYFMCWVKNKKWKYFSLMAHIYFYYKMNLFEALSAWVGLKSLIMWVSSCGLWYLLTTSVIYHYQWHQSAECQHWKHSYYFVLSRFSQLLH